MEFGFPLASKRKAKSVSSHYSLHLALADYARRNLVHLFCLVFVDILDLGVLCDWCIEDGVFRSDHHVGQLRRSASLSVPLFFAKRKDDSSKVSKQKDREKKTRAQESEKHLWRICTSLARVK